MSLLSGLRALRDGQRKRALARLGIGAVVLAVAVAQRRSRNSGRESDVEASDVVGTGSTLDGIADEAGGVGDEDHTAGEAASEGVATSPDVEETGSGVASETDAEGESIDQPDVATTGDDSQDLAAASEGGAADDEIEHEDVDRLGEAAFDGQSQEVPAPQQAFNQRFLSHSAEAFWGVRDRDDAVLVSQNYDALEGREGVRYVASSEIDEDERELPIPSAVRNEWDERRGGTALAPGEDVLFVTTDDLAVDGVLWILPAAWADDIFGEAE